VVKLAKIGVSIQSKSSIIMKFPRYIIDSEHCTGIAGRSSIPAEVQNWANLEKEIEER
jgi:hypothetical protein